MSRLSKSFLPATTLPRPASIVGRVVIGSCYRGFLAAGGITAAISAELGGFAAFKEAFVKAATTRFGSGWAWLSVDKNKKLVVESTPNQDSPLMHGNTPILGCDVWEHAYYLKYQNRRPDYLAAWWNTVNWQAVSQRYAKARG